MSNDLQLKGVSILLVEDDRLVRESIESELQRTGATVYVATDFNGVLKVFHETDISIIVAALDLVDEEAIEIVREYKKRFPDGLFYILTSPEYDSIEISQESARLLVDDYIKFPLDGERFSTMVTTTTGRPDAGSTSLTVLDPLITRVKPYFIFRSPAMRRALAHLPQIAASDQTVLISGETGTGKEIVARAVHVLSGRSAGPFIPVNCGAVPESLIEGELFGHEKGAFTGAVRTRKGKFETAHKGTLFLDEIGDMPLHLQVGLLRVLEEGVIYRVGGEAPVSVDVRIITASNIDLQKAVMDGLFREDLYYRLNVLRLHLPPLRERIEDIPLLAVHFLERAFAEMGRPEPYPSLSSETIYILERYPWKGNVRELRNVMTRIATLLPPDTYRIFPFHIRPHLEGELFFPEKSSEELREEGVFIPVGTPMAEAEDILIKKTLEQTGGNRTKAAALLGVSLRNLRRKLNK